MTDRDGNVKWEDRLAYESSRIVVDTPTDASFTYITDGDVCKVSYKDGILYTEKGQFEVGKIDLLMERFVDVLSAVPFMIVITLLK